MAGGGRRAGREMGGNKREKKGCRRDRKMRGVRKTEQLYRSRKKEQASRNALDADGTGRKTERNKTYAVINFLAKLTADFR